MEVSLGPCKIQFNGSDLGETLKSENVTLKVATKTQEIKCDDSDDIKDEIETSRDITFEATFLLTNALMSTLGISSNVTSLLRKGPLKITSLDKDEIETSRDITFEATFLLTNALMSTLGISSNVTSLLRKGPLKITSLDNNIIVDLYNVSLKIELNFNFKNDKTHTIKIKAKALKDSLKRDINIFVRR